jgi:DNA-binding SARP family transcriptional activator/energy-coupling factor transporter ATP-binding protein EcfA2
MTFELTLLGAFGARHGETAVSLPTRKAQALLAYLALAPDRAHERDTLCGLLWGDTGRDQAFSSLRQTLFGIRKALPPALKGALIANGRTVALDASQVRSDAARFTAHLAEPTRAGLEQAAVLYQGQLLEGFAIPEAPFEEWLGVERNRYAQLASAALVKLAQLQAEEGVLDRAVQTRLQLLRLEPWAEENHRALMWLYARQGRRAAALAQYQQCLTLLERELGVEPEPATRRMYDEIAGLDGGSSALLDTPRGTQARGETRTDTGEAPARLAHAPARGAAGAAALVGRARELALLRHGLEDGWAGTGRVALLIGEAGVGKTRLLEELAGLASARGAMLIRARCFESEQVLPFAPWVEALRGQVALSDEALRAGLAPALRAELSRLLPWGEQAQAHEIAAPENALRLLEAVRELLERLAQRAPLLLVLDDLQWADDMSLRLFSFLGRRLSRGARVFIAASLRQEELAPGSLLATALAELAREGCSFQVGVEPLTQAETMALVQSVSAGVAPDLDARVHEQIWGLSEGNPFVVLELARALAQGALRTDAALPVPGRVREVIAGHITRLPELERRLLAIAAVIGREFELALLCKAAEGDDVATAAAVESLSRVGLFKASGAKLYFAHERIREVVYAGLLAPRRNLLHGHVARALEALHAGALHEVYGRLAFHYGRADEPRAAVEYLTRFAEDAARSFGVEQALAALTEAGAFAERLPQSERPEWRLELAVRRAKCFFHLGRFAEIASCLEPHLPALDTLERPELGAQVHFWLGCANGLLGNTAAAASSGERSLQTALRGNGVRTARRAHTLLAWEAAFAGRFQKGVEHGLAATVSIAPEDAEPEYIASGWMTAGVNHLYAGRHEQALAALEQARRIAQAEGVPRVEALALGLNGLAHAERGQPAAALAAAERAVELAPDPVSSAGTLSLLAHVHVRAGRADAALQILSALGTDRIDDARPNQSSTLLALAEAYLLKGLLAQARAAAELTLGAARAAGHPLIAGATLRVLGQIALALGEAAGAREQLEESRRTLESIGASFQLGRSLCALAGAAEQLGDRAQALARLEQAEQLYRDLALETQAARVRTQLGELRAAQANDSARP